MVDKAKLIAAHMLEADPGDLEFKDGAFGVKGSPGSSKTIQEVAFEAFTAHDLPDGVEPTLQADSTFDPTTFSFPHGTHLCAVEVDTETGMTKIRKYVCVDDIGKVINPMIVEGQVHGGIAQGIAQALYEEAVYDADGNLVTGSSRRLPGAGGARPADFDDRPHRDAVDDEPAGRQGRRRGRHHRVDAGRGQRDRRRAAPVRRRRRPDAAAPRNGSGGPSRTPSRRAVSGAAGGTVAYGGASTESTAGGAQ